MPKIFHFIWFGSCLPEQYQKNIISFKDPRFKILLWIDYEALSPEEIKLMAHFAASEGIELCDIRKEELINKDLIIAELDRAREVKAREDRKKMVRIHYVRASDLARVAILYAHGGIYNDTDNQCIAPIPEDIKLTHGFLSEDTVLNKLTVKENSQALLFQVFFHFMAAVPKNKILEITAAISRVDYETYHSSTDRQWEYSDDRQSLLEGNVKLTGTSLKWALNYLMRSGQITVRYLHEIFLNTASFLETSFDKSWLQDFPPKSPRADEESLSTDEESLSTDEESLSPEEISVDKFCAQIESRRKEYYPLTPVHPKYFFPSFPSLMLPKKQPKRTIDVLEYKPNKFDIAEFSQPGIDFSKFEYQYKMPTTWPLEMPKYNPIKFEIPDFTFKLPDLTFLTVKDECLELKDIIKQVSKEYIDYSLLNCQYSIFHRHHSSGRQRVTKWLNNLDSIISLPCLQKEIIDYLSNNSNGNTYPHSFRIMLITRLCNKNDVSKTVQYDALLYELSDSFSTRQEPLDQCCGLDASVAVVIR